MDIDNSIIILGNLIAISIISLGFFLYLNRKNLNKKIIIYYLIGMLLISGSGMLRTSNLSLQHFSFICQCLFLFLGIFHCYLLFREEKLNSLNWAKRDTDNIDKDSFWSEFLFSLSICCLGLIGFYFTLLFYGDSDSHKTILLSTGLLLLLPFILVKTYDFFMQKKPRKYSNEWIYTNAPVHTDGWEKQEHIKIYFNISDSLKTQNAIFPNTVITEFKNAPIEENLGDIFKFAIIEKKKTTNISDLNGFELDQYLWLLFYKRFSFSNPKTWNIKNRLLNPDNSLKENNIKSGDKIYVKRNINK